MQIVRNNLQDLTTNDDAFSGEQAYLYHAKNGMVCLAEKGELELRNFSPKYKSRWQSPILYDKTQVPKRFLTELIGRENIGTLRLNSMDGRFEAGRLRVQAAYCSDLTSKPDSDIHSGSD